MKDLVIDIIDDDVSNELHEFALASPDNEDEEVNGQLLPSFSQLAKDNGKSLFDSIKHPTTIEANKEKFIEMSPEVARLKNQLFQTSPSDSSNKKQKSTFVSLSFSLSGNSSNKKVRTSVSRKGSHGGGKTVV
ncbi:hypothetical protein RIF29_26301 [Crotalaria pallida]|uniref:Uncharacterized protein n=1 Tax=Crotalaria pallida TaxID=3830 RepID=A0AAN9I1L8_CROPI